MALKERIILGVDPGTSVMGFGMIKCNSQKMELIQFGVIHLSKYKNHEVRLKKIFDKVSALLREYTPDEVALEAPFFGKDVQAMLKLGRAQGVAMAAALHLEIPVNEYAPRKIKQSVTGNGNASKEQVASMVKQLLNFKSPNKLLDATDALAVAMCHHFSFNKTSNRNNSCKSWKTFVSSNPNRVK